MFDLQLYYGKYLNKYTLCFKKKLKKRGVLTIMEYVLRIAIGLVLGMILGQKELEQLYREYKQSKGEETL